MTASRTLLLLVLFALATPASADPPKVQLPTTTASAGPNQLIGIAPDGSWAAFSAWKDIGDPGDPLNSGRVQVWNLRTGALDRSFSLPSLWRNESVDVSPDGKWLADTASDGTKWEFRLHDFRTGQLKRMIPTPNEYHRAIGFSADGSEVYTAVTTLPNGSQNRLAAWSTADGARLREVKLRTYRAVTLGPDGKTAIVIVDDAWKGHELWDLSTGERLANLGTAAVGGELPRFVRGGKEVALEVRDQYRPRFLLFDAATGKPLDPVRVPSKDKHPTERAISDDKSTVVVREYYGVLSAYDAGKAEPRWQVDLKSSHLRDLRFTPDGKRVIVVDPHERTWMLDAATGKTVFALDTDYRAVKALAFTDGGKALIAGMALWPKVHSGYPKQPEGFLLTWDTATGELKRAAGGADNYLHAIYPSPTGDRAIVTSGSYAAAEYAERAEWWDLTAGRQLKVLVTRDDKVSYFGGSADGRKVAGSRYVDGNASETWVWDPATGERLPNLPAHGSGAIRFTPNGEWIVAWDYRVGVHAIRTSTGKLTILLPTQSGMPGTTDPLPRPNGETFVGFSSQHQFGPRDLYLFDSGRRIKFATLEAWPTPIAMSANGKWVAVGAKHQDKPSAVYLCRVPEPAAFDEKKIVGGRWIAPEEQLVKPVLLEGHLGEVFALAFSPDGKTLATGGRDRLIRLWDVPTGKLKASLWLAPPTDPTAVPSDWVAFTPEGFFAGTPRGRAYLRLAEADPAEFFRPEKVRESLRGAKE